MAVLKIKAMQFDDIVDLEQSLKASEAVPFNNPENSFSNIIAFNKVLLFPLKFWHWLKFLINLFCQVSEDIQDIVCLNTFVMDEFCDHFFLNSNGAFQT